MPLLGLLLTVLNVSAQIPLTTFPVQLTATLRPGESISETISIDLGGQGPFPVYEYWGKLKVKAATGYEGWLTNVVPSEYTGVYRPGEDEEGVNHLRTGWPYTFDITIKVPDGTDPGMYLFSIYPYFTDDQGDPIEPELWVTGQIIKITVTLAQVIPEVPHGTISAILAMVAAMTLTLIARKY